MENNNDIKKEKETNWFTRILIIILALLIASMIIFNFYIAEKGVIENGLLALISLLILLILSEAFDNLSFGKILSLSKNVSEKKKEIHEIKNEKKELLHLLVSNLSIQKQSQNIGISASELKDIIRIMKADPDKVAEENKEKEEELDKTSADINHRKRIDFRKFEKIVFEKYMSKENLNKYILREQIQLASNDPISSTSPIIDGYIETENAEIFIEIKRSRSALMLREGLYQRLMNVYYYRQVKNINTYLVLILVDFPDDEKPSRLKERVEKDFAPAIDKNILKIINLKIDKREQDKIYRE